MAECDHLYNGHVDHNPLTDMKKKFTIIPISFLLLSLFASLVVAQTGGGFNLSWSSLDGGGGFSTGGNFALTGSAGQADAGVLSGGDFSVNGGFIQCVAVAPAALQISLSNNDIQLNWSGDQANVYRAANSPYFAPNTPYASNTMTNWTDSGAAGTPSANYTYIIRANGNCGESSNSQRVGQFNFALTPGD